MVKKLVKYGNSLALVIDKPILDLLRIDADTELSIATDGKSLVVSPSDPARAKKIKAAFDDTIKRYPNMLRRLAQ